MRRPHANLVCLVLAAFVAVGCHKVEKGLAAVLISDEEEAKLGAQVHTELVNQGLKYLDDPTTTAYVTELTNKVVQFANEDRPGVAWHVHVVDTKDVNAFAVPGGHLFINRGLLMAAGNEAEVVGVMGHECGHVVARHSARQMVAAYGIETVLAVALGKDPGTLAEIASAIATNGALLAHSRSDEREADELGVRYASRANYDPRGIVQFFERLGAQQGQTPEVLTWISTHPSHEERVQEVEQQIASEQLTGSVTNQAQLKTIQDHLKTLPAAP